MPRRSANHAFNFAIFAGVHLGWVGLIMIIVLIKPRKKLVDPLPLPMHANELPVAGVNTAGEPRAPSLIEHAASVDPKT